VPVIAVRWWGTGKGSGEVAQPPPQEKNIFSVSASYSSDLAIIIILMDSVLEAGSISSVLYTVVYNGTISNVLCGCTI